MTLRVAFDISALNPAFKAHAQRGTGRYVTELKKYFDCSNDQQLRISYFDQSSLLGGSRAECVIDRLPYGKQTVRQQLLYPFRLKNGVEADVLHFPAHLDAPAWSLRNYVVTVLDLIRWC